MKNPIVSTILILAVLVVLIVGVLQFGIGPAQAQAKAKQLNTQLETFKSSQGAITSGATTEEVLNAICAGRASSNVMIPQNYQARSFSLSPVYEPQYDASSNSFKVSFSLLRFLTHKPYVSNVIASNS